jgi:hypothetical protein
VKNFYIHNTAAVGSSCRRRLAPADQLQLEKYLGMDTLRSHINNPGIIQPTGENKQKQNKKYLKIHILAV